MNPDARVLEPAPMGLSRSEFVARFGGIYENSPWVARCAWDAGLPEDADTVGGLARALAEIVDRAGSDDKLALLRAHPDLAGRAAVAGELTAASTAEQASAGIDQCSPEEFARFTEYNARYKRRFGIPFIMAVRGSNRHAILTAFEQRLDNDRGTEFATALRQVHKIARLRLESMAE